MPELLRGRTALVLRVARPGDEAAGEAATAPLRALAPTFLDTVGVLPVARAAEIHNDPVNPGPSWVRGYMLDRADDDLVSTWLRLVGPGRRPSVRGRRAASRRRCDRDGRRAGSAVSGRSAAFVASLVAVDPTTFLTTVPAAARTIAEALAPWASRELNPNFAGTGTAVWEPAAADRLEQVRRTYDPAGVVGATPVWGGWVKAARVLARRVTRRCDPRGGVG